MMVVSKRLIRMERETRIELATNSLEGCDSTIELLPPLFYFTRRRLISGATARGVACRAVMKDRRPCPVSASFLAYPWHTPLRPPFKRSIIHCPGGLMT